MADIKQYIQFKNKMDKNNGTSSDVVQGKNRFIVNTSEKEDFDEEYKKKLREHRKRVAILIGIAVTIIIAIAVIIWINIDNRQYTGYNILHSVNKDDSITAEYIEYNGGYIRYSNDGISYYSAKGTALWNQTYEMKNPQIKICNKSVVVGDINGSSIYVFNEAGMVGSIDTSLSISQIEVGSQGVVAAVLEDTSANYINLYSTSGKKIYSVKTTLAGDGYPLDIGISDDATKLVASYVYVNGESIKTNVVFYNFSDVGQNETERVVGGFNHYDSTIVPEVKFVNEKCAVAIGENIVSIYKIKEYPSITKEIKIESEIDRVFLSDRYIGLVLKNADSGDIYKLVVYDLSGNKLCEATFNTEYNRIMFDEKSIVMYNDTTFTLMNLKGKVQYNQTFSLPIQEVLSLNSKGNYILVSSKYIQEIKLK